jgi:Protein of unknown function (DUF4238)
MPARPKQQHYVTRAYLEGFLEPGHEFLFCYGRKRRSSFEGRPGQFARQRSYYSVRRPDGTWDDSLERDIELHVERPGLEVIRKLSKGKSRLDWSERNALAMFIALQRFRVPHMRQLLDAFHAETVRSLLNEHDRRERQEGPGRLWIQSLSPIARSEEDGRPRTYVTREELEAAQRSLQEDPGQFSRESLFEMAESFARVFCRMKWTVHHQAENTSFITSDCPVLLWHERPDIDHAGISRPDTHVEFPLTRNALLSMTHDFVLIESVKKARPGSGVRRLLENLPEVRITQANEALVHEFNLRQAQYCSQWVFAGRQNDWPIEILQGRSRNVRQRVVRVGNLIRIETLAGK